MSKNKGPTWAPKADDYFQVFMEQSPWQQGDRVPDALALPVQRPLAKMLWRRLQTNEPKRFQLILGPRRVGKSTSLYQTVQNLMAAGVAKKRLWWLRLDHPLLMQLALDDLATWVINMAKATVEQPAFLFLDELTYARDWDLWLKTFYDEKRPLQIAGSSSSTAALRNRRVESGVGRWDEQYLAPYLFNEYLSLIGRGVEIPVQATLTETLDACIDSHLDLSGLTELRRRFLLTGGFPELLMAFKDNHADDANALLQSQRILRNDAVERAIYKDIPQAFGVAHTMLLERLLYALAGQVTGILSPQTLSQNLSGMTQPTVDRYVSYLERAFLVFTLPNYSGSEMAVQKRGRKLYFVDGAVRNAALQRGIAPLSDTGEMGMLIENLVAGHLHALSQQSQVRLYHWRDGNDEVDLVYDHPEKPLAFEIASSPTHDRRGLNLFKQRYPKFDGHCYVVAPSAPAMRPSSGLGNVGMLPLDLLLLAIGAQAEKELERRLSA
jgi:hypothetical protein